MLCVHLPIFNDGVCNARVGVVVGSCLARLHKQLCVGDGGSCINLHEDHLLQVHVHWVSAGLLLLPEPLALKEFKLKAERTKAFLCEGIWVFVPESQRQVDAFGIGT